MSIHGGDYITRHPIDARRDSPRCGSCHRLQTFCAGCHLRSGVAQSSPEGGFAGRPSRGFHPPGFAGVRAGPGHHAREARRNLRACVSCHQERDCLRCHTSARGGRRGLGGVSPHGPGFGRTLRCRRIRGRNTRVCLRCHAEADPTWICR